MPNPPSFRTISMVKRMVSTMLATILPVEMRVEMRVKMRVKDICIWFARRHVDGIRMIAVEDEYGG